MFSRSRLALLVMAIWAGVASADEPVRLQEQFPAGTQYHVDTISHGTGILVLPPDKDNPKGKSLSLTAESKISYDERILDDGAKGQPQKTVRINRRVELQRTHEKEKMEITLRDPFRRLVVTRANTIKNAFSLDGPLTYGEVDLIHKDVFTPGLAGLLPTQAVRPGETWKAGAEAVQELTGIDKIEEGSFDCKFEGIFPVAGRNQARVAVTGTVRGVDDDGPCRHQIDGFFYFDMAAQSLGYLTFRGTHFLLDKDGKEAGKFEGSFTLSRQMNARVAELTDAALRGLSLEPTDENTRLLFDNAELGLRFVYARRWRVNGINGPQVMIDEVRNTGNGLLLTVVPLKNVPTAAQYQSECEKFIAEQKGKIIGAQKPRQIQAGTMAIENFALEVDMAGQRVILDYYIMRQAEGGATLSARLLAADARALMPEMEKLAKTVVISKK
jgi:hypothetical protein